MVEDIDNLAKIGFLGCDYVKSAIPDDAVFDPHDHNCLMCEFGECYLFDEHMEDKDVLNHFYVEQDIEYPFILISRPPISCCDPAIIEIVTIQEAKENTKYVSE